MRGGDTANNMCNLDTNTVTDPWFVDTAKRCPSALQSMPFTPDRSGRLSMLTVSCRLEVAWILMLNGIENIILKKKQLQTTNSRVTYCHRKTQPVRACLTRQYPSTCLYGFLPNCNLLVMVNCQKM